MDTVVSTPLNQRKMHPERSRRAENGAHVFSFSSTSSKPLPKKSLEKEKDFLVIGQLPVPRTVVLQAEENCFIHSNILSTHQKHLSFIGKGF